MAPWSSRPPEGSNLSGIAHVEDDCYILVSDKGAHLLWGEIKVDPRSGVVQSAVLADQVAQLQGGIDVEACAIAPDGNSIVVADEADASLSSFPMVWGRGCGLIQLNKRRDVVAGARENLSLESLATGADGKGYWTISEDALTDDGPRASAQAGAWLRLQRVDLDFSPVRQWAYHTDRVPGAFLLPGGVSGVADILALPDGSLVMLERSLGIRGFRIRLYLVRPDASLPDVSSVAHLDRTQGVAPLPKELLFEWHGRSNFEGITLGPPLEGGARSVLLVADDGDPVSTPGLLALKLERVESR